MELDWFLSNKEVQPTWPIGMYVKQVLQCRLYMRLTSEVIICSRLASLFLTCTVVPLPTVGEFTNRAKLSNFTMSMSYLFAMLSSSLGETALFRSSSRSLNVAESRRFRG
jgi:hypothetical protein